MYLLVAHAEVLAVLKIFQNLAVTKQMQSKELNQNSNNTNWNLNNVNSHQH